MITFDRFWQDSLTRFHRCTLRMQPSWKSRPQANRSG